MPVDARRPRRLVRPPPARALDEVVAREEGLVVRVVVEGADLLFRGREGDRLDVVCLNMSDKINEIWIACCSLWYIICFLGFLTERTTRVRFFLQLFNLLYCVFSHDRHSILYYHAYITSYALDYTL